MNQGTEKVKFVSSRNDDKRFDRLLTSVESRVNQGYNRMQQHVQAKQSRARHLSQYAVQVSTRMRRLEEDSEMEKGIKQVTDRERIEKKLRTAEKGIRTYSREISERNYAKEQTTHSALKSFHEREVSMQKRLKDK